MPHSNARLPKALPEDGSRESVGVVRFISDDWRTWHFQSSESPDKWHTVDLASFALSGECSCENFQIKIFPLLRDSVIKPHAVRSKCKHIKRAERVLTYRIKREIFLKQNPNPKRT
jgi:hypothetical protein